MELKEFLLHKLAGVRRLAVLGVGSELRGDDGAGSIIAERLAMEFPRAAYANLVVCGGGTAPENFCGNIRTFRPEHLLVVDAADAGCAPGAVVEIRQKDIGGPEFSTHMLPLKLMVEYIVGETGCAVTMLGLQYECVDFGADMTQSMRETVDEVLQALREVIPELLGKQGPG